MRSSSSVLRQPATPCSAGTVVATVLA